MCEKGCVREGVRERMREKGCAREEEISQRALALRRRAAEVLTLFDF